jgi:prolyl oligopeptidase
VPPRRLSSLAALALVACLGATAAPPDPSGGGDPFLWLESVHSPRATAWVKAENAKTLAVLAHDPHFAPFDREARAIGEATDRIPAPEFVNGEIYNFWQDAAHVHGIWRHTTLADYETPQPHWKIALDLDALSAAEHKSWVWEGANCDSPSKTRCLVSLSDGGEDATTVREYDLTAQAFVPNGFVLPHSKQDAVWEDDDTLLVGREWTPGDVTASGYPYIVKRLKRGMPLESAVEVARGTKHDVSVNAQELDDGAGHRAIFIGEGLSFFESAYSLVTPAGPVPVPLPKKSDLRELVAGRLLVHLDEAWTVGAATFPAGALVSLDLDALRADPAHPAPSLVYAPGPRETFGEASATHGALVVTSYANVRGRAAIYTPAPGNMWTMRALALPDDSSIGIATTNRDGNEAILSVTSFLVPSTLVLADTGTATLATVKTSPPRFDASRDVVEQREAISTDGTHVPYFIVHPRDAKFDGSNPTILYGYGGFSVSLTPSYGAVLGKLWLERGGSYVLANIRGGGEFGPAWHEAGLNVHRQRIYDDFAAVAHALIASKFTSPRRLGIEGGSNGGLLMGVEFTEHPELWGAVDIQVPLLDMLRFEHIAAGASWVGEYGSVTVPAQRAFLAKISPYANLRPGVRYPEPLVWTTTKDDRVGPQHARKFAAKLAALHDPYLFYEVTEGGHGAGANIAERAFTSALEYTYFTRRLME